MPDLLLLTCSNNIIVRNKIRSTNNARRPTSTTSKNAITTLPNELWSEILSSLSKKELKVVRLIGDRYLEIQASSHLFVTAYIAARRGVFEIFKQMTSHRTIRHFIKEVVYDCSWLDPPYDINQLRNGRYRITNDCSNLLVAKLFQEQERIQTRELPQALKKGFAGLKQLRRVRFADLARTAGLPGDKVRFDGQPLLNRIESGLWSAFTGQCCLRGLNERECRFHQGVFRRQYEGLLMLLRVLSDSSLPAFDDLSLGDGRHSCDVIDFDHRGTWAGSSYGSIPNWIFTSMSFRYLDKSYCPLFQRLRKLELTLCFPSRPAAVNMDFCPASSFPRLSALWDLLNAADSLEDLRLCGHTDSANLNLFEALGLKRWEKLRNLELRYIDATYDELVDVLLRHERSLRRVKLDFVNLLNGSWPQLDNHIASEMRDLVITTGWVWHNGIHYSPDDCEKDPIWIPREEEDEFSGDRGDVRFSSGEDDSDHSSDSEDWDAEDDP